MNGEAADVFTKTLKTVTLGPHENVYPHQDCRLSAFCCHILRQREFYFRRTADVLLCEWSTARIA